MEDIDALYGEAALEKAVIEALDKTRKFINIEIGKALKNSEYNFTDGQGYSKGETRDSLTEVSKMEVERDGNYYVAYAGFDLKEAPQALILAVEGAPDRSPDLKLRSAIKVKGKIKKEVDKIQARVFTSKLGGGATNDQTR